MLACQRDKFFIPEDVAYLNCGYMAPNMKSVETAGIEGIRRKNLPFEITKDEFFEPLSKVKSLFAKIIHLNDPERVAIIPSVSYGIASVARNIKPKLYGNIVVAAEQFPSNYYAWKRFADTYDLQMRQVRPSEGPNRGQNWNEAILENIDSQTVLVAIGNIHWADGTKFDLSALREKTRQCGALLILDGTQSVGAMPFNINDVQPDALICASYKWLLGPYSIGLAYFSEAFDSGIPIEENWINRQGSDNFQGLVNYEDRSLPRARRYSVGEASNFVLLPMLGAAMEQILEWQPENIQAYAKNLSTPYIAQLQEMGASVEETQYRSHHLFGVRLGENFDLELLQNQFQKEKVYVSFRGNSVRISVNVFNHERDMEQLIACFEKAKMARAY